MTGPRLRASETVSIGATVNLLDYARALPIDWHKLDSFVPQLARLRYVVEVNDAHMFWISLDFETSRPEVAARRINGTLAKVERLLSRYRKAK